MEQIAGRKGQWYPVEGRDSIFQVPNLELFPQGNEQTGNGFPVLFNVIRDGKTFYVGRVILTVPHKHIYWGELTSKDVDLDGLQYLEQFREEYDLLEARRTVEFSSKWAETRQKWVNMEKSLMNDWDQPANVADKLDFVDPSERLLAFTREWLLSGGPKTGLLEEAFRYGYIDQRGNKTFKLQSKCDPSLYPENKDFASYWLDNISWQVGITRNLVNTARIIMLCASFIEEGHLYSGTLMDGTNVIHTKNRITYHRHNWSAIRANDLQRLWNERFYHEVVEKPTGHRREYVPQEIQEAFRRMDFDTRLSTKPDVICPELNFRELRTYLKLSKEGRNHIYTGTETPQYEYARQEPEYVESEQRTFAESLTA